MSELAAHFFEVDDKGGGNALPEIALYEQWLEVEAIWRDLETRGVLTPYQRYDWLHGLVAAQGEPEGRMVIAVISQHRRPVALLPLLIKCRAGIVYARMLGAHQSNSDWLLAEPGFRPSAEQLQALLARIANAAGGFDILMLLNQPARWQGVDNVLLSLKHEPGPSHLYTAHIENAPVPYIAHRLTKKRRSNITRGRRRLEEMFGPVQLVRVDDAALLKRTHGVFLEQRALRFDSMGIANVFAKAPFPQLFEQLTSAGFGEEHPALSAHALLAGDEIVATCWGVIAGTHYSQYINSTASGPASRFSLTAIMVAELMDELVAAGMTSFDMGLGDFDYKTDWTSPEPVYDSITPFTAKGRLVALVLRQRARLKRLVKQTPQLWRGAKWIRRTLHQWRRA